MVDRLERLRVKLAENDLDAFIVSQPKNRSYISGVSSSDGYLIVSQQDAVLALDSRYAGWASREASPALGIRILQIQGETQKWLPGIISSMNVSTIGFEDTGISYSVYSNILEAINLLGKKIELIPVSNMMSKLRAVKDKDELKLLQKAAVVADSAFERIKQQITVGMTEKQIAWLLESCLRENGSSAVPFGIIAASGSNAAFPHHAATDRPVSEHDAVILDFGARVGGYGSDITRTLCLGRQSDKFKEIYNVVLDAQQRAIDNVASGMTGREADAIARDVITDAGYGDYFLHALGHSTGLEVHEEPRLSQTSEDILADGMVFTIEPGIYIPGWGGVRIEDMVVLEKGKTRLLTHASK